ncbi:DNA repair exonuclease [Fructilactobacillus cliffordii]|uniref:metallophosphoesterase family protein n=1 Tax=Fructilactobacillus cliffordii TaxID=2940299 RepID=UPI002093EA36|nr:DNA repair exonuclease [Fructilactobacillus cliffordii]USS86765.1 DNA repair exonuclease [Fructilactobacillus cliffordii]
MKFIHTADLHLDTPFTGIRDDEAAPTALWKMLHDAPYVSFERIVTDAIQASVDFVLIVGDVFDSKNPSAAAHNFLLEQLQRLNEQQIPVFLSFGNHDFQPNGKAQLHFPENVQVFGPQVETKHLTLKDGTTVAINGFSYDQQAIAADMVRDYPTGSQADFTIGMLHGAVKSGTDSRYAPFTVPELEEKGYDYWALGHIHKRQQLDANPPINYPGDIQGRHKNEPGEKGYLLVTTNADEHALTTEFIATAPVVYAPLEITVTQAMNVTEVVEQLVSTIQQSDFSKLHLLNVILNATTAGVNAVVAINAQNGILLGQLQQVLRSQYDQLNAWVYELTVNETESLQFADLDEAFWQHTQAEVFNESHVNELAKKLFQHDFIYQALGNPSELTELRRHSETFLQGKTNQEDFTDED